MKTATRMTTAGCLLMLLTACTESMDPTDPTMEPDGGEPDGGAPTDPFVLADHLLFPEPGVPTVISVSLMCNPWTCDVGELFTEKLIAEIEVTEGDDICVDIEEPSDYNGYGSAQADGFFTELVDCREGSATVDLDKVPDADAAMAGTLIFAQEAYPDNYGRKRTIDLDGPDGLSFSIATDDQGRFGLKGLPLGVYTLTVPPNDEYTPPDAYVAEIENSTGLDYRDLVFTDFEQLD